MTWTWSDNDTIATSNCPAASAATVSGKGKVPIADCRTTETISGVATPAKLKVTTTGSHGLGRFTVTCSGAVSTAGTRQAQPEQITYTVIR